jgi:hypothetical protein
MQKLYNTTCLSLVMKCSIISKYLHITETRLEIDKKYGTLRQTVFSNHNSLVHKYKLIKIKKYISHTFKID